MFKLPELQGHMCPRDEPHVIYFSADYDYFDKHGFALQQSINRTVGWIHVHCHIINEGNINVILVSDTDILADHFWIRKQDMLGVSLLALRT